VEGAVAGRMSGGRYDDGQTNSILFDRICLALFDRICLAVEREPSRVKIREQDQRGAASSSSSREDR
jgi:hypothetical protein